MKRPGERQSLCKPCFNARRRTRYATNPESELLLSKQWQKENREKTSHYQKESRKRHPEVQIEAQRRYEASKHGQAVRAAYKESNSEKIAREKRLYKLRKQDQVKKSNADYRERIGKQEIARRSKESHEKKPDYYREKRRTWKSENKDKVNAMTNNRRARIKGLAGSYTVKQLEALYDHYSRTCLWCRRREPEIVLSPDHIVAVTRQGATNYITNIQPLCAGIGGCNYRKGNRNFDFRPYWPDAVPTDILFE